ncbi:MAG: MFS transporter [Betaproteobacteria bacterium]|nr:MFS transporter [Betaproteobacteria bacterium]
METRQLASQRAQGWLLVAAAVALLAVTMGSRTVFGLFISPLNSATGMGIAAISLAVAVSQLTWGLAQPLAGVLAERYGAARVIAAGCVLAAGCGALLPLAGSAVTLSVILGFAGVAATVGSPSLLVGTVSARFTPEKRGLVAGIVGAGGPLGQLLLAPATQGLITLAGWTTAMFSVAALSIAALPLALAFRRRPAPAGAPRAADQPSATVREALASREFWLINATFFVCGVHVFFLVTHLPGVIELCGLPASVSGVALALLGLFNIVGSVGAGWVIQRFSMQRTLSLLFAARAIGVGLFLVAPKTELTVFAFSVWMGVTYMAVLPPTAGLVAKLFGAGRLATLLGVVFMLHQVGAFLGSWLGGVALELTGSYDTMWQLDVLLALLAAVVSLTIPGQRGAPREQPIAPAALPPTSPARA